MEPVFSSTGTKRDLRESAAELTDQTTDSLSTKMIRKETFANENLDQGVPIFKITLPSYSPRK